MEEDFQTQGSSSSTDADCAVCLQKCHHPTKLPCGHIFCFLCVKGVAIQNKTCALCRAVIPTDYLDHPIILEKLTSTSNVNDNDAKFQWYYEGRNGWWKYDERSNEELEEYFSNGASKCTLLLAGALYVIDFKNMVQRRRSNDTKRRRICRDTPLLPAKGIAGIKIENNLNGPKTDEDEIVLDGTSPLISPDDTIIESDRSPSLQDPDIVNDQITPQYVSEDPQIDSNGSPSLESPDDPNNMSDGPLQAPEYLNIVLDGNTPQNDLESPEEIQNVMNEDHPNESEDEINVIIGTINSLNLDTTSPENAV